ncbi:MAG: TatD family hydrolase [Candidatus Omnitrophota bacterium]|jgi:TatD DNase family protein
MLIDTHCHLDFPEFDPDRDEVIRRAKNEGVGCIINIGSSLEGSERGVELAKEYDSVYASVGLHPHEADKFNQKTRDILEGLAKKDKVVAVGEIGLDYYRNYAQAENQKTLFLSLAGLAKDLGLPLVIHNRQADEDTLRVLKEVMPVEAVVHCFSGDEKFLKECLGLGFFISFTCNITYKKAESLKNMVKLAPLERILLETDAPFLPPEGSRGRRNEPVNVKFAAEAISRIKGIDVKEVARITTDNATSFFKLTRADLGLC